MFWWDDSDRTDTKDCQVLRMELIRSMPGNNNHATIYNYAVSLITKNGKIIEDQASLTYDSEDCSMWYCVGDMKFVEVGKIPEEDKEKHLKYRIESCGLFDE